MVQNNLKTRKSTKINKKKTKHPKKTHEKSVKIVQQTLVTFVKKTCVCRVQFISLKESHFNSKTMNKRKTF